MQTVAAPSLKTSTTAEELRALARAAKVNLLADATLFSTAPKTRSLQGDKRLSDWLLEVGYTDNLTWGQTEGRTFLVWSEPDAIRVAKALIAQDQREAEQTQNTEAAPAQDDLADLLFPEVKTGRAQLILADYLQETYNWDGQSKLKVEFELSELPPEAAATVLNVAASNIEKSLLERRKHWSSSQRPWLTDALWKSAEVGYFQTPDGQTVLAVHGTSEGNDMFTTIERPIVFPDVSWRPTAPEVPLADDIEGRQTLTSKELRAEKSLAVPISLDLTGASLQEVLTELQKQSGLILTSTPGLLPDKKVAAQTSAMPLSDVMNALSGLYGIVWAKTDGGYFAQVGLSAIQVDALQLGDPQMFHFWKNPIRAADAPAEMEVPQVVNLGAELNNAGIEDAQLSRPQGVKFSALPVAVQALIRRNVEERFAGELLNYYNKTFLGHSGLSEKSGATATIRVEAPSRRSSATIGAKTIEIGPFLYAVLVENGKDVFSFGLYNQQQRQQIKKRIQKYEEMQVQMAARGQGGARR